MTAPFAREPHWLSRNKGTSVPSRLLFVDTETTPKPVPGVRGQEVHNFRLGVYEYVRFSGRSVRSENRAGFQRPQDFWEFTYAHCDPRTPLYVFAHNLGFDFAVLGGWAEVRAGRIAFERPLRVNPEGGEGGPKHVESMAGSLILDGPPTIIQGWHGPCKLVFLDSLNYFRYSLAQLGQLLGLKKFPLPFFDLSDKVWFKYCSRDVAILKKAVLRYLLFIKENDFGQFRWTLAGQAFGAFRHRFMPFGIHIHGCNDALRLERAGYRGGRATLHFYGRTPAKLYRLDVSSLYASVMQSNRFPAEILSHAAAPGLSRFALAIEEGRAVARVRIDSATHDYPLKTSKEVIYARGKFTTVLCGPELRAAWLRGHVKSIGEIATYRTETLFNKYVTALWGLRDQFHRSADEFGARVCKDLLVALHGKFAQKGVEYAPKANLVSPVEGEVWHQIQVENGKVDAIRTVAGKASLILRGVEAPDSFPAIAAFVTSYARMLMDKYREVAGEENVILQYVDALIVTEEGYARLRAGNCVADRELGKLRLIDTSEGGEFYGPADYVWDGKPVISGLSRQATRLGHSKYLDRTFLAGPSQQFSARSDTILVQNVVKLLRRVPPPGPVGPDGRVGPIYLQEW